MRCGIDSLSGIVRNHLNKNPLSGELFVFVNKRRNQLKLLHWQEDGFALFYKRLEKGTYELPKPSNQTGQITPQEMLFMLQGVKLKSVQLHTRYAHCGVGK